MREIFREEGYVMELVTKERNIEPILSGRDYRSVNEHRMMRAGLVFSTKKKPKNLTVQEISLPNYDNLF